ncbi:MAG: phosphotransferase family protein [Actinomycetota bacterium]
MLSTDAAVRAWLEANLGPIVAMRRQARWRPVWFATVAIDDAPREVVVRGDRVDMELIFPLDHEMRFQDVVHGAGIPVPAVHGWIDGADAYVMDAVPGQPYLVEAEPAERDSVMDEYMGALAALHRLPLEPFLDADIVRASDPSRSGAVGLARYEERFRRAKRHPDPLLEFGLAWLRRHPARSHGREGPIVWDSGQFHHADGRLVALLDLELGHIGDPMMDLAAFRMRDTIGGFGDFARLYGAYEADGGFEVDLDAVKTHHVAFTLSNRLAFSSAIREAVPGSDLMTNLQWCRETDLFTTEALAEIHGIDLPDIDLPDPARTRAAVALEQLVETLRGVDIDDEYQRYEVRTAFRLARHAQRSDEIEDELNAADLDDLQAILGTRPTDWHAGEAALEAFVLDDDGRHDHALIELFHKRNLRAQALLGPAGSAMTTHRRIQPFHA